MFRLTFAALACAVLFCVAIARAEDTNAGASAPSMSATWAFVRRSVERNAEVQAAHTRGEQAVATADAMSAPLYNPEIEGGFEQFKNDDRRPSKYDVGLAWTLDLSGKANARGRAGAAEAEGAVAEAQRTRLDVARRLISTIASLSVALKREKNAAAQTDAARQFLDVSERSFRAGDVGKPDVDIAKLAQLEAEGERRAAESERLSAQLDLAQLCACEPGEAPPLPDLIPEPPELADTEIERLAEQSLDVAIARTRVGAARGSYDFAQRSRVPDPTLSVGIGQEDGQQLYRLGLSIPIPVLNSGEAEARAANFGLAASELDLRRAAQSAAARLRASHAAYRSAFLNLQSWRGDGSSAVAARFDQLRRLLAARELTTTEYLVQLREALSAASRGLEAERSAWAAFADWIAVTNGLPAPLGDKK
jgi:cobalt-zinc-cadmium efflux system outer membrane protein